MEKVRRGFHWSIATCRGILIIIDYFNRYHEVTFLDSKSTECFIESLVSTFFDF